MRVCERVRSTVFIPNKGEANSALPDLFLLRAPLTRVTPQTPHQVKTALTRFGVAPDNILLLDALLAYAGSGKRAPGMYVGS